MDTLSFEALIILIQTVTHASSESLLTIVVLAAMIFSYAIVKINLEKKD